LAKGEVTVIFRQQLNLNDKSKTTLDDGRMIWKPALCMKKTAYKEQHHC